MINFERLFYLCFLLSTFVACSNVQDQVHLKFEEIEPSGESAIGFQVENGRFVGVEQFPSVYRLAQGRRCTATQVGPRVVILAAHCFGRNSKIQYSISLSFKSETNPVLGSCQISNHYPEDATADVALCLLERVVARPFYETLDLSSKVSVGANLMFGGFGCWRDENGRLQKYSTKLAIGVGKAVEKPRPLDTSADFIYTVADIENNEAVLCRGDSGGPTFFATSTFDEKRAIVAINARVISEYDTSLFAQLSSPINAAFIRTWVDERALSEEIEVCGVNIEFGCA